jgi:site-specific DNA-methyltransferase (adenine-specific)
VNYKIGDCREVLKEYPDDSFDSCVTDPPYGLEFMGKEWDKFRQDGSSKYFHNPAGETEKGFGAKDFGTPIKALPRFAGGHALYDFVLDWAVEVYRVLKPGAFLLSFGGTRTYHRMACAVEDAGFEIRDMIPWIYGSGFPKSLNVGNGIGTGLKPAIEPIVVARKPLSEKNVALNVLKYGTGGINVDGCRIEGVVGKPWGRVHPKRGNYPGWVLDNDLVEAPEPNPQGRFPANLILECICEEVVPGKIVGNGHVPKLGKAASQSIYGDYNYVEKDERYLKEQSIIHTNPNCPCYLLDEQSGELKSGSLLQSHQPQIKQKGIYGELGTDRISRDYLQDNGGASRFFYVAKASRKERYFHCSVCQKAYPGDQRDNHRKHMMHCDDCGCDYEPQFKELDFVNRNTLNMSPEGGRKYFYADDHKEHASRSNLLFHVTQKPEQLIRYLIKLVTPRKGTVLDPFLGSGTTLVAAHREGFDSFGIELGAEYEPLIKARTSALPRRLDEF